MKLKIAVATIVMIAVVAVVGGIVYQSVKGNEKEVGALEIDTFGVAQADGGTESTGADTQGKENEQVTQEENTDGKADAGNASNTGGAEAGDAGTSAASKDVSGTSSGTSGNISGNTGSSTGNTGDTGSSAGNASSGVSGNTTGSSGQAVNHTNTSGGSSQKNNSGTHGTYTGDDDEFIGGVDPSAGENTSQGQAPQGGESNSSQGNSDSEVADGANLVYEYYSGNRAAIVKGSVASGNVVLPDTVTKDGISYQIVKISRAAFMDSGDLKTIKIGAYVTDIDSQAFQNCVSLISVEFPSGLKNILYWAFNNCKSLTSVNVPSGANVDAEAFINCPNLN